MKKKILFFMFLSMANISYCETQINQVEQNLHKVVEKFDMDIANEKTYAKSKQQEALIRQKELELKRAVDEHNKNMKKNAKAKNYKKERQKSLVLEVCLHHLKKWKSKKTSSKNYVVT